MKYLRSALLIASVLSLAGCGTIFMYMMGARGSAVPLSQITPLYYKTSPDLKKAYLFYRIPGRIATGMGTGYGSVGNARSITIDIGAVKDTPRNRVEFGEGISSHYKVGDDWVAEFDIGDNDSTKPHDKQIKIFYGIDRRDRNEAIPYCGIWKRSTKEQNKSSLRTGRSSTVSTSITPTCPGGRT